MSDCRRECQKFLLQDCCFLCARNIWPAEDWLHGLICHIVCQECLCTLRFSSSPFRPHSRCGYNAHHSQVLAVQHHRVPNLTWLNISCGTSSCDFKEGGLCRYRVWARNERCAQSASQRAGRRQSPERPAARRHLPRSWTPLTLLWVCTGKCIWRPLRDSRNERGEGRGVVPHQPMSCKY